MTAQRDADRQLRDWVSSGADRAPERFVWAALDEIQRVPQRQAWRSRLDGLLLRNRPAAALLGAGATMLVAVAVALQLAGPSVGPGSPPRSLTVNDLPSIVVWETTKPATWTLDNLVSNGTEVRRIPIRSLSDAQLAALPNPQGYLGGRYADFSGPDAVFMSFALVFERDLDAAAALPFYENELSAAAGWGLGVGTRSDLGQGGLVYEGSTTRLTGDPGDPVPARIYLWRHGNVLLALGGWFAYDPDELDDVAAAMDQRAADLAAGRN